MFQRLIDNLAADIETVDKKLSDKLKMVRIE